jgi:guanylate kinase
MGLRLKQALYPVRTVMLLTSDHNVLRDRLISRGHCGHDLEARLAHALEEEVHAPLYDFVVPDADIVSQDMARRVLAEIASMRDI